MSILLENFVSLELATPKEFCVERRSVLMCWYVKILFGRGSSLKKCIKKRVCVCFSFSSLLAFHAAATARKSQQRRSFLV